MTPYQVSRAVRRRAALVSSLGGRCELCGAEDELQIHHVYGITWTAAAVSSDTRIARYEKEAALGLVGVLCKSCNAKTPPEPRPATFNPPFVEVWE